MALGTIFLWKSPVRQWLRHNSHCRGKLCLLYLQLQSDLCLGGDSEGVEFSEQGPAVPHRPQIWGAVTWELGLESPTEPQGRTMQKDKRENPMRPALGSQGSMSCLCTVAGVKWYLGFVSILVWRLHFCQLQEDSIWGAAAPLRGRALWGTSAAELPLCSLRKQNLWILLN